MSLNIPHICSSSLLELPNELFLVIATYLDNDGLLYLAATCKRLNLLLLPTLFKRHQYSLPASSMEGSLPPLSFNGESLVVLPAIAIASYIHSIEDIDCAFFAYNRYVLPKEIFDAARALHALATRLRYLGHLRFNPYVAGHSMHELFGWSLAVCAILNSAIERPEGDCAITVYSGLRDDYVSDPRPYSHVFPNQPKQSSTNPAPRLPNASQHRLSLGTSLVQKVRKALASIFRRRRPSSNTANHNTPPLISCPSPSPLYHNGIHSTLRPPALPLTPPVKPTLTSLSIHSSFLLHANFYLWTVDTLNASPALSTLSLAHIDLSHYDWHLTLPRLKLSGLQVLRVGAGVNVSVPDLDDFLGRHTRLTELDLRGHVAIGALVPGFAVKANVEGKVNGAAKGKNTSGRVEEFLPNLKKLLATPDYLLYFLTEDASSPSSSSSRPPSPSVTLIPFPALHYVGAASDDDTSYSYQIGLFEAVVDCLEMRRERVIGVSSNSKMNAKTKLEVLGRLAWHCQVPEHLRVKESDGFLSGSGKGNGSERRRNWSADVWE